MYKHKTNRRFTFERVICDILYQYNILYYKEFRFKRDEYESINRTKRKINLTICIFLLLFYFSPRISRQVSDFNPVTSYFNRPQSIKLCAIPRVASKRPIFFFLSNAVRKCICRHGIRLGDATI